MRNNAHLRHTHTLKLTTDTQNTPHETQQVYRGNPACERALRKSTVSGGHKSQIYTEKHVSESRCWGGGVRGDGDGLTNRLAK